MSHWKTASLLACALAKFPVAFVDEMTKGQRKIRDALNLNLSARQKQAVKRKELRPPVYTTTTDRNAAKRARRAARKT